MFVIINGFSVTIRTTKGTYTIVFGNLLIDINTAIGTNIDILSGSCKGIIEKLSLLLLEIREDFVYKRGGIHEKKVRFYITILIIQAEEKLHCL